MDIPSEDVVCGLWTLCLKVWSLDMQSEDVVYGHCLKMLSRDSTLQLKKQRKAHNAAHLNLYHDALAVRQILSSDMTCMHCQPGYFNTLKFYFVTG